MTQMQMEGQVAVVTGGAGGIGTGIAQCLAAQGARVVITGRRDQAALDAAAAALPGDGHWGYCVAVDDTPGMERFAAALEARYGRLDVLVNNAGITKWVAHDDLDGLDDELIDTVFRVNWRGPFVGIRVFRKLLEAGSGGVVINISSGSGTSGFGSNVAYCAAKAGINMMTRSLARALAPKVRVLAVAPGFVDTGFVSKDPSWVDSKAKNCLLRDHILPTDIGNAVVAACTQLRMTTGAIIPVDGGEF